MIPVDNPGVLDKSIELLQHYAEVNNAKGRFVAIYLGLRRMGDLMAPLGSSYFTTMVQMQEFLDQMWVKAHREDGREVLTAPFGGSSSAGGGYSARTGAIAPGLLSATNTWRNNFGIQKGVGCAAPAEEISSLIEYPDPRPRCRHLGVDNDGNYCTLTGTRYRGEEHSIWVANRKEGYQVVDLDEVEAYQPYLQPGGVKIPIYPLIAVLYSLADPNFYPRRSTVGIADFAEDFGYSMEEAYSIFDCDPVGLGRPRC